MREFDSPPQVADLASTVKTIATCASTHFSTERFAALFQAMGYFPDQLRPSVDRGLEPGDRRAHLWVSIGAVERERDISSRMI
ncbi:hypothetical protein [Novosphingobium kaempferiae]|uniref:hypothetical protein n=1 Tax=Novosphingobium kaempferiae TaxID=2896849 RepID=UPI001E62A4B2|nr:hypothetical protein [Novosphingobium kaempferiae]